jgi:hypothetical protein
MVKSSLFGRQYTPFLKIKLNKDFELVIMFSFIISYDKGKVGP